MGQSASDLAALPANPQLTKLVSPQPILNSDAFWNELLQYQLSIPLRVSTDKALYSATEALCKEFHDSTSLSGNFTSLVHVALVHCTQALSDYENSTIISQSRNALFILRCTLQHWTQHYTADGVLSCFSSCADDSDARSTDSSTILVDCSLDELLNSLVTLLVDLPITRLTASLHLEATSCLLCLLASALRLTPIEECPVFEHLISGKASVRAPYLIKSLLYNLSANEKLEDLSPVAPAESGVWSSLTTGLFSALSFMDGDSVTEEGRLLHPLARNSLLLLLALVHYSTAERNPFCSALHRFDDITLALTDKDEEPSFKYPLSSLYMSLGQLATSEPVTLLNYLLLHNNRCWSTFALAQSRHDILLLPLLRILYEPVEFASTQVYMSLVSLLMMTEDSNFCRAVHDCVPDSATVSWYKDAHAVGSLGGLIVVTLVNLLKTNLCEQNDKYVHSNCLAALGNMSAHLHDLSQHVSQRLIALLAFVTKRYLRLHGDNKESEDATVLGETLQVLLEVVNSVLLHVPQHNVHLIYALLHQRTVLLPLSRLAHFKELTANVDFAMEFFCNKLEGVQHQSAHELVSFLQLAMRTFPITRLRHFPELKFRYQQSDSADFLVPYVWQLVMARSGLYFDPAFVVLTGGAASDEV